MFSWAQCSPGALHSSLYNRPTPVFVPLISAPKTPSSPIATWAGLPTLARTLGPTCPAPEARGLALYMLEQANALKMEIVCRKGQTHKPPITNLVSFTLLFVSEMPGPPMWQRNCPVCQKPLEKKHPAETVCCPCGKYVWKG